VITYNNMRIAIINITGGEISDEYKKYLKNMIPKMAKKPRSRRNSLSCISLSKY